MIFISVLVPYARYNVQFQAVTTFTCSLVFQQFSFSVEDVIALKIALRRAISDTFVVKAAIS
jgi:hypothetical protein